MRTQHPGLLRVSLGSAQSEARSLRGSDVPFPLGWADAWDSQLGPQPGSGRGALGSRRAPAIPAAPPSAVCSLTSFSHVQEKVGRIETFLDLPNAHLWVLSHYCPKFEAGFTLRAGFRFVGCCLELSRPCLGLK